VDQKSRQRITGRSRINWGHASSPAVHDGALYLICYHDRASYLLSLDAKTGAVRWKADQPAGVTSYSTPVVVANGAGAAEVVVNSSLGVAGHSAATGERLWTFDEPNRFPVPMPAVQNGIIYTTRGYRSSPVHGHPARRQGRHHEYPRRLACRVRRSVHLVARGVRGIDLHGRRRRRAHGDRRQKWRARPSIAYRRRLQRVARCADGKIYLLSEDGETTVVSAGRTPGILSHNKLDARQLASPAISGGRLFIRSDDALYAIGK
jgi:outer membrane protein assembly factor BamB